MSILFISGSEIVVVFLAVLLLFGAKSIPDMARMLGKGMREFRKATDEIQREFNESSSGIKREIQQTTQSIDHTIQDIQNDLDSATK
jgi:sec-independent protein translocase protein TatA